MKIDHTDHTADKAEGDCLGFPYNTELVSSQGVGILFWLGDRDRSDPGTEELLERALLEAIRNRNIVRASCCPGSPSGYWAHQDIIVERKESPLEG
jgi:hypothetical protein